MGLSSKRTKTTTNQNTTATIAPTNPQFTTDAIGGLTGRVNDYFSKVDPASLVAGPDPLQTSAGADAAGLSSSPNFGKATDILTGVAGAGPQNVDGVNIADYIKQFQNPFTDQVVNTSLADYDQGTGYTRAQNKLDLAGDTTFGGSSGALQTTLSNDAIDRGRGSLAAGLRSDGFNTAAGLAAQQAGMESQRRLANAQFGETALNRQGAAAGGLADVGSAMGADSRANIGTKADIGAILQQLADAKAKAGVNSLGANADILGKIPFDLLRGSNATGSLDGTSVGKSSGAGIGDWLNFFAQNASSAASAAGGG